MSEFNGILNEKYAELLTSRIARYEEFNAKIELELEIEALHANEISEYMELLKREHKVNEERIDKFKKILKSRSGYQVHENHNNNELSEIDNHVSQPEQSESKDETKK